MCPVRVEAPQPLEQSCTEMPGLRTSPGLVPGWLVAVEAGGLTCSDHWAAFSWAGVAQLAWVGCSWTRGDVADAGGLTCFNLVVAHGPMASVGPGAVSPL